MSSYSIEDIRNIALLGHAGSGKTTLIRMLLNIIELGMRIEKRVMFMGLISSFLEMW